MAGSVIKGQKGKVKFLSSYNQNEHFDLPNWILKLLTCLAGIQLLP